jgi:ABC-type Fe3+ transport system permease subunit
VPRKWLRQAAEVAILTLRFRTPTAPLLTDYFVSSPVAGSGKISRSPAGRNIGSRGKSTRMGKLILRSFCVGIASIALAGFVGGFIALSLSFFNSSASSPAGDQDVGWDLIALARNVSPWIYVVPLAVFATGFLIGFRYFSKRQARQEVSG